jgi:hypothetical protein
MNIGRLFKVFALAFVFFISGEAQAHIGSPNVFFQGLAGSYPIRVTIQPPGVVPGLAQIQVIVSSGEATRVAVRPVRWDVGVKGSPAPDNAVLVSGETNMYSAQLWLMASGAYSVFVEISGSRGDGIAIVPLNSVAMQRLAMSRPMELVFMFGGLFVAVLLISVVGAAIREARLDPGAGFSVSQRGKGWIARGITAIVIGAALFGGNLWWNGVDKDYRYRRLYQPQKLRMKLDTGATGEQRLTLRFKPESRMDSTPLVTDHGHLMHLFLIREPDAGFFAHLHPIRKPRDPGADSDETKFTANLPALPAGNYNLYADITHESGLTQTLTNILTIPAEAASSRVSETFADSDDSVLLSPPVEVSNVILPGGLRLEPGFPGTLKVNQETNLVFQMTTADGTPAALEPFLGMYGHLIIENSDGSVFSHIHPLGSVSMESQRLFAEREKSGFLANKPLEQFCTAAMPELSFPYAFPKAGIYRLWLQTKVAGKILTAAYSITVN